MALAFKSQPFEERNGKIYFRRGRTGPVYEITEDEKTTLAREAGTLRQQMIVLISAFALLFIATLLFLPQILDMSYQMALMIIFVLLFVSIIPFLLLVKFHLGHQKKIRNILGTRNAVSPESLNAKSPAQKRLGVNTGRLAIIFLLGVAITTVGIVMLFSGDDLPFRKQLIWWMNLLTGSLLTGLGLYGLLRKKPERTNPPGFSRDD